MQVSAEAIRTLRERTGAGIMDCKRVLETTNGNIQEAEAALRERGIAKAAAKVSRSTTEGVIEAYVHAGGRIAALVELNCETDFVARTPEFKELAHNLAMQIAAMAPLYLDQDEMPSDDAQIVQDVCLLHQPFIKDPSQTIKDLILELMAKVGENIRVRKMVRFNLGD